MKAWLINPYICQHFPLRKQNYHVEQMRTFCFPLTATKQMLFVIARVDAVPFKIITTEDIQQPRDRTVCQRQAQTAKTRKNTQ